MPQVRHIEYYSRERTVLRKEDVPDCIWPTDNPYDIPVLNRNFMANACDVPVVQWGSRKRTDFMFGTYSFYVDDYRFDPLWADPTPIINSHCNSIIEPNFSVHDQLPHAIALYNTYRKRWLARFWQEFGGIRVFVDLNVGREYWETNLIGVPQGWTSYATRGYTGQEQDIYEQYRFAIDHAGGDSKKDSMLFVVYGGGQSIKDLAREHHWIWLAEQMDHQRKKPIASDVAHLQGGDKKAREIVFSLNGETNWGAVKKSVHENQQTMFD